MSVKSVLKEQILLVKPEKEVIGRIKEISKDFIDRLNSKLRSSEINADVFVGGSFAKNTLVKKDKYDVDIFVRFSWEYETLSDDLEPVIKKICNEIKKPYERVHGSRDYFKINIDKNLELEVIPVTKIKKPIEERNVTDLSYFHVSYVKKQGKKISDDIILAKAFCHGQKVYGAESYINGFSGYALECLVIHYKSFEKMLKELVKVKERIVIDPAKHFKRKNNVFFELSENKLQSPVILIDPTYKERNALAALNHETFLKFQKSAKKFLKKPSKKFFVGQEIDIKKLMKTKKGEFVHVKLKTDKQPGDIAGTKLKKFSKWLEKETSKYFKIAQTEFEYDQNDIADFYLIAKSKKEIIRIGPPLKMKKHVKAFKRENKKTFEKNGLIHSKVKIDFNLKDFIQNVKKERKNIVKEMGITKIDIS